MKLHPHHILPLHNRRKLPSVLSNCRSRLHNRSPPRMRVIHKPTILHSSQQPRIRPNSLQRIPPHMRRLQLRPTIKSREALTQPPKVPQPLRPLRLSRPLKQPLQPNTNPQEPSHPSPHSPALRQSTPTPAAAESPENAQPPAARPSPPLAPQPDPASPESPRPNNSEPSRRW